MTQIRVLTGNDAEHAAHKLGYKNAKYCLGANVSQFPFSGVNLGINTETNEILLVSGTGLLKKKTGKFLNVETKLQNGKK